MRSTTACITRCSRVCGSCLAARASVTAFNSSLPPTTRSCSTWHWRCSRVRQANLAYSESTEWTDSTESWRMMPRCRRPCGNTILRSEGDRSCRPRAPSPSSRRSCSLVEGKDEVNFFTAVLRNHLLLGGIQVIDYAAKAKLSAFLRTLLADPASASITGIGIIRDADVTPPAKDKCRGIRV